MAMAMMMAPIHLVEDAKREARGNCPTATRVVLEVMAVDTIIALDR